MATSGPVRQRAQRPVQSLTLPLRVLFVVSEVYPLVKTGGLGDVAGSLPPALMGLGHDLRLMLPAYPGVVDGLDQPLTVARIELSGYPVSLIEGCLPGTKVRVWAVECPLLFDRSGSPYSDPDGEPWPDNAQRFALLSRVAVMVANDEIGLNWQPDLVHAHDWQTGLVPALLGLQKRRPATLFTIHNLAYIGAYPYEVFAQLKLPAALWDFRALEFHGQMALIKGGLTAADRVNTVSPTYAREIQRPEQGCGLDGVLRHRASRLSGIVNGIDTAVWNPVTDPCLVANYSARPLVVGKGRCKAALQQAFGLPVSASLPLLALVGRLVEQKGIDLLLELLPALLLKPLQLVVLGTGQAGFESQLRGWAQRFPDRFGLKLEYDESMAHRIEAGADIFLMPSRFEPCGLNQLYSQRYGTPPVVHRVGGLADTTVDAAEEGGTGFLFDQPSSRAFGQALDRALGCYRQTRVWRRLQRNGMGMDFSWQRSAMAYSALYRQALEERAVQLKPG